MATKNSPGPFGCYEKAEPDEELFVLLGRDVTAAMVVTFWIAMRIEMGGDPGDPQLEEARSCARRMEEWARLKGKDTTAALAAFKRVVAGAARRSEDR